MPAYPPGYTVGMNAWLFRIAVALCLATGGWTPLHYATFYLENELSPSAEIIEVLVGAILVQRDERGGGGAIAPPTTSEEELDQKRPSQAFPTPASAALHCTWHYVLLGQNLENFCGAT